MKTEALSYQERTYRKFSDDNGRFKYFNVSYLETDLLVAVDCLSYCTEIEQYVFERIIFYRKLIENYSKRNSSFFTSFKPLMIDYDSPKIVEEMMKAALKSGTGPMASVAGAFSEFIANDVIEKYKIREIIIENGGDIFLKITKSVNISVFAGDSILSEKVGIKINEKDSPLGICTSAGTVGHSKSFGNADAVMIVCKNTLLADALATTYANFVQTKNDVNIIIERIKNNPIVLSAFVIKNDIVAYEGKFDLLIV